MSEEKQWSGSIEIAHVARDRGNSWTARLPATIAIGDTSDEPNRSDLILYENDYALGPAHSGHDRIRLIGEGGYSHWGETLYFSSSDNSDPTKNGRTYKMVCCRRTADGHVSDGVQPGNSALSPRLEKVQDIIRKVVRGRARSVDAHDQGLQQAQQEKSALYTRLEKVEELLRDVARHASLDQLQSPSGTVEERLSMLESKIDYALDELYTLKSQTRHLVSHSELIERIRAYQAQTFDYQWKNLPFHQEFPSNPEWRNTTKTDLCQRLEVSPDWFKGKRVLDCGCGPGRHSWTMAEMGADVIAFDVSDNALNAARELCRAMPCPMSRSTN